jgi:hypothetical protein
MAMMLSGCLDNKVLRERREVLEELLIDYNHSIIRPVLQEEEEVPSDPNKID